MAIIAKSSGDGQSFDPAPAGAHRAVCVDVIDRGILDVTWQGQTKKQHKVDLAWQIDEAREDGKRFLVFKRYTLSLNEKAALRKDLESWRGRAFTREEEMGFDVEAVIGKSCLLNVAQNRKGDRTYANVVSVMPLMKGMGAMVAEDYTRVSERAAAATEQTTNGGALNGPQFEEAVPPLTDDDIPF